jgi:hypothetical protein
MQGHRADSAVAGHRRWSTLGTLGGRRLPPLDDQHLPSVPRPRAPWPQLSSCPLLAAARDGFSAGLNVAAGLSVAGFAALAIVAAVALRHLRPYGDAHASETDNSPAAASSGHDS